MKETPINALPFPEDSDAPDGPTQIGALAEALDVLKWGSRNLKPTVGVKAASGDLTLTGSYQDVPGATLEITPAVASTLKVTAIFEFDLEDEHSNIPKGVGSVKLDSEAEDTAVARLEGPEGGYARATVTEVYAIALTAAAHTLKLRAKKESGDKGTLRKGSTRFLYELVAS